MQWSAGRFVRTAVQSVKKILELQESECLPADE